ncbi:MAG: gliding motility-associated-like protein [Saprospiraceae bacterium]|jgi:gliding motility-associated-like protein
MYMYSLFMKINIERQTQFNFKPVIFLFILFFISFSQSYGQGAICENSEELCPADGVTYPATTGSSPAPPGNNYGCLGTEPNPAWFFIEISQAGNININLTNSNNVDIDFAMWGPFASLPIALSNCGSLSAPSDCSYSAASSEIASIVNGTVGQIYILMITNFSNSPTEISGSATGTGVASCDGVCLADGGALNQEDLSGCTGDPDLNIMINPSYVLPAVEPNASSYGYTFLVSNTTGTIIMTLDGPDMSSLPPGDYTICGLSYKLDEAALVNTAIGQTVASLQSSFNNETALFCGDTSDDCFDLSVGIPNPPIFRDTMACVGTFITLPDGSSCAAPGACTYSVDIGTGCDQDITYIVAPLLPTTESIVATVCEGECVTIDGVDYCDIAQAIILENAAGCDSILVLNISFIAVSAEIADPDMLSCTNQMVTLDGSTSDGNVFEWYNESNVLVGTTNMLDVTTPGCYTLTAINNMVDPPCTNEATVCVIQDGGGTPTTPIPTGTSPVCAPGAGLYSITPETDITYNWTVSGNGNVASGQGTDEITVSWTSAGIANVCVTASNACGNGTQECFPVTINTVPVDPVIAGDTPVCPNGTGNYFVPFDATATNYSWIVPAGASITTGDNTASISVSFGSTAGSVCVIVTNECGNAPQYCFPVTLFDLPADANVSGPTDICPGETVTYTSPSDINTTVYDWVVPSCATIDNGQGSNTITVTWGIGCTDAGDVCVAVSNACGTGQGDCLPVSLSTVTEMPEVSTTETNVCDCDITMASVTDAATATNIVWSVPLGATITAGQGTANITIDWCNAQSGDVCATLTYACGMADDCSAVTAFATPTANAGGDDSVCGLTYDLDATASVGAGTWSYAGAGTADFLNASAAQTSVTVDDFGTYTFIWTENNNSCTDSDDVIINFNASPTIDGGITETCNGTNTTYSISFNVTGALLPYSTTGITGTWVGSVFTSDEITSGANYSFTISDANNCVSQTYNGLFTCDCETDAGTIQVEQLEACIDQTLTATHNGDENLDANDISQFILHDGDPIGGVIFAANNTGTFGLTPPMVAETIYYIALAVGDADGMGNVDLSAPCAGFTEGTPVIFHEYPTPNAGTDDAICGLTYDLSAMPDVAGGSWSQTGGAGTAAFIDENAPNTSVTVSETGIYTFTWSEDNSGCLGNDDIDITFNPSPEITGVINEVCNGINTAYTITFDATGGALPYMASGIAGTWIGGTFTSTEITSGATYTFTISDTNGCISQEYNGAFTCDCETDAGTIQVEQLEACIDQTVTATHNGDEILDANDISQFILHDGDPIGGVIFSANNTGIFGLTPPMVAETTYYIAFVVGDDDGMGNVDLDAVCADLTEVTPVIFYDYPTPIAGTDDAICGLTYDLYATPIFAGGMWSSVDATVVFGDVTDANTSVTVTTFGVYNFIWTENNNGCEGTDEVEITFNAAPELVAPQLETCDLAANDYTVMFSITGGQAPYFVDGVMIAGTDFTSTPIGSNVTYSFEVTDTNGCGPITVTGERNCDCQSDAGTMTQTLQEACIGETVTGLPLGDEVNDGDDVVQYVLHDGNGTILGTDNTPTFGLVPPMTTGVTYYISTIIGNDLGGGIVDMNDPCFSMAVGTPVIFNPLPDGIIAGDTAICEDGSTNIFFELIGTPPFSVVFDGVTLIDQAAFFTQIVMPLATTDYSLTEVTDANGCVQTVNSTVTITVNTPPFATIDAAANVCNSTDNGNPTTLNFSNFITAGDETGTWDDTEGSGAMGTFANLDFTGVTPGDYTFTYTTAAANVPCTNVSYTITIIVEDCVCPSVATSAPDALCNDGGNLDLTSLQVTDQAGTWVIISQPMGASEILNGTDFATAGIPAGDYIFEFTLTNIPPEDCPTTSQETLTVNQEVSAGTPNGALDFCVASGMNVNLNDEIISADIGGAWTETSDNSSIGNAFNANAGTFNLNNQSAGTYTFRYTVTGVAPCGDDFSEVTVTINPAPTADAGETDVITCEKEEVTVGGTSTQGGNISYLWEATEGGILNPDEISSLNLTALSGGIYTLTVTNDLTGCFDTDVVIITEAVELPMPFFSISDISCFGESDGLITVDSVEGGQAPYVYSLDGENFNTTTFFPGLSGGDYTISVQDANGCLNAIMFNFPEPSEMAVELFAVLEGDNTIRFGDSVALNLNFAADVAFDSLDNVIWTPSEVLSCDTCQMTWAMPFETTNFSVTIEEGGCSATDNLTLVVKRDAPIFVPNVFSPNNDGNNEVLMIFAGDQVAKVNAFVVYDRWGEVVHEYYQFFPNDPAFGWDGTWRGQPMNPAVFAWYAEVELIDGRIEIIEGDVTLVR